MPDFNIRADSVNVEQIMEQIRARIREKRGVDYTEEEIRHLADVKLERFLDPKGLRSDLLEQFRKVQPPYEPPELPNYAFEESTLYDSHRGLIRAIRTLLNPLLKLLFNPNPLIQALNIQARLNTMAAERDARRESARRASDQLFYELIHNLVLETTRLSIEVKNVKMRVESIASRLEFNERRVRALESAVVYRSVEAGDESLEAPMAEGPRAGGGGPTAPPPQSAPAPQGGVPGEGPGQRSRRRRRRRGRRGRGPAASIMGAPQPGAGESAPSASNDVPHDDLATFPGAESHPSEPIRAPRTDRGDGEPDAQ